jgi:choline dehydrogenase
MPRITTGNTMAPSVVIGERGADLIRAAHGMSAQSQLSGLCV